MNERKNEREREREKERERIFFSHHDYNRFDLQLSVRKDGVSI